MAGQPFRSRKQITCKSYNAIRVSFIKFCNQCKQEKPITSFSKKAASNDGLHYACKSCAADKRKADYIKNKARILDSNAKSRAKNQESIKRGKKMYYEKIKLEPEWQARELAVRQENKEAKRIYDKEYCIKNAEKRKPVIKAWVDANRDKIAIYKSRWAERNPADAVATQSTRRARIFSSSGRFTHKDVRRIVLMQRGRCASCLCLFPKSGKNRYHADHIMPLALGGTNWPDNIQALCPPCNLRKSAKHPIQWANENGLLC